MPRRVYAVLINGATEYSGVTDAIETVEELLRSPTTTLTKLTGSDATRANVLEAVNAKHTEDGDLFVLMFAGHGVPASQTQPYQAWSLNDVPFSDQDLAEVLLSLKSEVTMVVISACCYGAGIFTLGPRRIDPSRLKDIENELGKHVDVHRPLSLDILLNLRFSSVTRTAILEAARRKKYQDSDPKVPLICLSAATYNSGVVLDEVHLFASEIVSAAKQGKTYDQLAETFEQTRRTGRDYQVDVRPSNDRNDVVLDRT